jgi:hypothetical protein
MGVEAALGIGALVALVDADSDGMLRPAANAAAPTTATIMARLGQLKRTSFTATS